MNGKPGKESNRISPLETHSHPDTLKGSYYANPIVGDPDVSPEQRSAHPEYYGKNIWPAADERGVEGFEEAFKDLGR